MIAARGVLKSYGQRDTKARLPLTDGFRNYTVMFENGTGILIMTSSSNGESIYAELLETLLKNTFTPLEWEGFPRHSGGL